MRFEIKLYDFLAFFLPGILIITWIFFVLLTFDVPLEPLENDLLVTIVVVSIAYFLGNMIQAIGSLVERKILIKLWGGLPSVYLLDEDNDYYTDIFKAEVFTKYEQKLRFHKVRLFNDPKYRMEAFKVASAKYGKENDDVKLLNASYAFLRGVYLTLAFLLIGSVFHYFAFISLIPLRNEYSFFWLSGIVVVYFLVFLSTFLFFARYKKRGEDYADLVFRTLISR